MNKSTVSNQSVSRDGTVYLNLSTKPGDPSTLWQSPETGKWYRRKKDALTDSGEVVNPEDVEIEKSWFYNNRKVVIAIAVAAAIGILYHLISTKKILL